MSNGESEEAATIDDQGSGSAVVGIVATSDELVATGTNREGDFVCAWVALEADEPHRITELESVNGRPIGTHSGGWAGWCGGFAVDP